MIDKELVEILGCPKCGGSLSLMEMFLVCQNCKLAFPILDGVPDLLLEDAWKLEEAEKNFFKHNLHL